MQDRQGERNLFEAAVGNVADESDIGRARLEAGYRDPGAVPAELKTALAQGHDRDDRAPATEGAEQPGAVPIRLVREDDDAGHCRSKERASSAASMLPRRKQRPVSSAVTSTRPGL